jgi:hypothetical protein
MVHEKKVEYPASSKSPIRVTLYDGRNCMFEPCSHVESTHIASIVRVSGIDHESRRRK